MVITGNIAQSNSRKEQELWDILLNNSTLNFTRDTKQRTTEGKIISAKYFTRNNFFNNELINSLKDYEKNILEIYLNNNIQPFLVLVDENMKKITNKYDLINNKTSIIKKILENENLEKVQMFKIKTEFEGLEKDIKYKQLNYLTVIITGRTGVGKSALINALLKEHLAEME